MGNHKNHHTGHPHDASSHSHGEHHHGKHHHMTRAERREAERRARIAEQNEQRTHAIEVAREHSGQELTPQMTLWEQQLSVRPPSTEVEISPLKVPMLVTSQFDDPRTRPDGKHYLHTAFDGKPATPATDPEVVAMVSGTILFAKQYDPASGYTVVIGGNNGKMYSYIHLKSIDATVGQYVSQGQAIGILGHSGNAVGMESGCIHVTVREPGEEMDQAAARSDTSSPDEIGNLLDSKNEQGVNLAHFKRVWPTINGEKVYRGSVIPAGTPSPDPTPEQLAAQASAKGVIKDMQTVIPPRSVITPQEIASPLSASALTQNIPAPSQLKQ